MTSTVVTKHPRSTAESIVVGKIMTSAAGLAALDSGRDLRGHASKTKP